MNGWCDRRFGNCLTYLVFSFIEHRRTEQPSSSDEDAGIDMTNDNCSETSAQSDLKSNHEEAGKDFFNKELNYEYGKKIYTHKNDDHPVKNVNRYVGATRERVFY